VHIDFFITAFTKSGKHLLSPPSRCASTTHPFAINVHATITQTIVKVFKLCFVVLLPPQAHTHSYRGVHPGRTLFAASACNHVPMFERRPTNVVPVESFRPVNNIEGIICFGPCFLNVLALCSNPNHTTASCYKVSISV
jgi:hypothetical protein